MRLTRAELNEFRGSAIPDLVGPNTKLLLAGINPGLRAAAVQAHFGGGSNRFYPALYAAGIVDRRIDATNGFIPADREHLLERGVGITSLVPSATARADELDDADLVAGAVQLADRVAQLGPHAVAMLGITAYRVAFARPKATVGLQPEQITGVPLWVVPNPSGLNAHESLASLAAAYREVAIAAGIRVYPEPNP